MDLNRRVYLIELEEGIELKEILKEHDNRVQVRKLSSDTLEEYDNRMYYDDILMADMPKYVKIADTICICWGRPGIGFGEVVFYTDDDGNLKCDNEGMSREFIKEVLCDLVDNATLDFEKV